MGTIADKLDYAYNARVDVQEAINTKGVGCTDSTPFCEYGALIRSIQSGGGGDTPPSPMPSGGGKYSVCPGFQVSFEGAGYMPFDTACIWQPLLYHIVVSSFEEVT